MLPAQQEGAETLLGPPFPVSLLGTTKHRRGSCSGFSWWGASLPPSSPFCSPECDQRLHSAPRGIPALDCCGEDILSCPGVEGWGLAPERPMWESRLDLGSRSKLKFGGFLWIFGKSLNASEPQAPKCQVERIILAYSKQWNTHRVRTQGRGEVSQPGGESSLTGIRTSENRGSWKGFYLTALSQAESFDR